MKPPKEINFDNSVIERDGILPEWVGAFMNRRGTVEDLLRLPITNQRKGLPLPEWFPPTAEKLNDFANLLSVPAEFQPDGDQVQIIEQSETRDGKIALTLKMGEKETTVLVDFDNRPDTD